MKHWPVTMSLALSCLFSELRAEFVQVTVRLDTNTIPADGGTFLRVFAQVKPEHRSAADQIFSWHVDVLNTNGAAALAAYDELTTPASDNDPLVSSRGFTDGTDRRGIFDTFLDHPRAGVTRAVELLVIPVRGQQGGNTRFQVRAGTGSPLLSADFLIAPLTGDAPWIGGDFSEAFADLTVIPVQPPNTAPVLSPIPDYAIEAGATLTFTNTATDADLPANTLIFSLVEAPDGATIDLATGVFAWTPAPSQIPSTNMITVRVTDDGVPPLSDMKTFTVVVSSLPPNPQWLSISTARLAGNLNRVALSYTNLGSGDVFILFRDHLNPSASWQEFPNGPHNTGVFYDTNNVPIRFYRIEGR